MKSRGPNPPGVVIHRGFGPQRGAGRFCGKPTGVRRLSVMSDETSLISKAANHPSRETGRVSPSSGCRSAIGKDGHLAGGPISRPSGFNN